MEIKFDYELRVFLLWLSWSAVGLISVLANKSLLLVFPYPSTSCANQLLLTFFLIFCLNLNNGSENNLILDVFSEKKINLFIALSVLNFISISGMHLGVFLLSASYAHTVKSTLPVFVVIISRLLGQTFNLQTYVAIALIIVGISITSQNEYSFNTIGFILTVCSTMASAGYGLLMKRIMSLVKLQEVQLIQITSGLTLLIGLPMWCFVDLPRLYADRNLLLTKKPVKLLTLLLTDGVARFLQNVLSLRLLARLTPVGYSVGNVIKRVFIIASAILFFDTPVSVTTIIGIGMAMLGLLIYNLFKSNQGSGTMNVNSSEKLPLTVDNGLQDDVIVDAEFPSSHKV